MTAYLMQLLSIVVQQGYAIPFSGGVGSQRALEHDPSLVSFICVFCLFLWCTTVIWENLVGNTFVC